MLQPRRERFAEKIFVSVLSVTKPDGNIVPMKLIWEDGVPGTSTRCWTCAQVWRARPEVRASATCAVLAVMSVSYGIHTGSGLLRERLFCKKERFIKRSRSNQHPSCTLFAMTSKRPSF